MVTKHVYICIRKLSLTITCTSIHTLGERKQKKKKTIIIYIKKKLYTAVEPAKKAPRAPTSTVIATQPLY